MLIPLFLSLILVFYVLNKICDEYFVPLLYDLSQKFKLTKEATAATIMAVGSSAPELFISLIALFSPGNHEVIGMGTIVGSALFNLLFVTGVSAFVGKHTKLHWHIVLRDMIFYLLSIGLLILFFQDEKIFFWESITLVILYGLYIFSVVLWKKIFPPSFSLYEVENNMALSWRRIYKNIDKDVTKTWELTFFKHDFFVVLERYIETILSWFLPFKKWMLLYFLNALCLIVGLSWIIVDFAVRIAQIMDIPESLIALTVLAIGASLPDFLTSYIVSRDGQPQMGIENPIASNVFDVLFGLGFPWLFFTLLYGNQITISKTGIIPSVLILLGCVFLFFLLVVSGKWSLNRWSGIFLIVLYGFFILWIFMESYIPILTLFNL